MSGTNLQFNDGRKKHIYDRHISTTSNPDASKFIFQSNVQESEKLGMVMALARIVFNSGKDLAFSSGKHWLVVYGTPLYKVGDTFYGGMGKDKDNGNLITNVVTLVLGSDCRSVKTIYPGLPNQIALRVDPRIGGYPAFWGLSYWIGILKND